MIKKFKPLFTLRKKPKSEIDNSSEEQSLYSNSNLDSSKKIETTPIEESIENKSYNSRYTHISDYNVKSDYNRNSSLFSDELNNNDYDNNELGSTFNIQKTEDEIAEHNHHSIEHNSDELNNNKSENQYSNQSRSNTDSNNYKELYTDKEYNFIYKDDDLSFRAIHFLAVLTFIAGGYYLISSIDNLNLKLVLSFIFLTIIIYVPALFFGRFYKVIRNEERRENSLPSNGIMFFISAIRNPFVSFIMFFISSLIILNSIITPNANNYTILGVAFIAHAIISKLISEEFISKLTNNGNVYINDFFRLFITALITGLIILGTTLAIYIPNTNLETQITSFNEIANHTKNSGQLSYIICQVFSTTGVILTTLFSSTQNSLLYYAFKLLFIAIPFAFVAIHISICLSLLTLNTNMYKYILMKHKWTKNYKNFFQKHWKEILLPTFLLSLFYSGYHFGMPLYEKYKNQLFYTSTVTEKLNAEVIGDNLYTLGTLNEINILKQNTANKIKNLLRGYFIEINHDFDELKKNSPSFVSWFEKQSNSKQIMPGDMFIINSFISSMDIKKTDLVVNNIRKELSVELSEIYKKLETDITKHLELRLYNEAKNGKPLTDKSKTPLDLIYTINLENGGRINLKENNFFELDPINVEKMLTKQLRDYNSLWFVHNRNVFQKQQDDSSTSAKRITQADLNKLLNSEISKTQKYVNSQFNSYIGLKTKDLYEFENIDEDVDSTNQVTPTDSTNTNTLSTVQTYQEVTHDDKKDANEETDNELQILEDELFNDE